MLSTNNIYSFFLLSISDKNTVTYYTKQNRINVIEEKIPTWESNIIEDSSDQQTEIIEQEADEILKELPEPTQELEDCDDDDDEETDLIAE